MKKQLSRTRSVAVVVMLAVALVILAIVWNVAGKPFDKPAAAGDLSPAFQLMDENGHSISSADLSGRISVLSFGTTWCQSCSSEDAELEKFYTAWKDKGVTVLKVDFRETPLVVQLYKKQQQVGLPYAMDRDGQVTLTDFRVVPFPTTIIIDQHGVVRARFEIPITQQDLEDHIRPLLG
ncbi:MAG: hypothetical protein JWN30_1318 [Bacilli bacterium]|nr:hypothetical protein [Bacilli bacterium]